MDWLGQAEELLHEGESIREQVPVGEGGVVVTNHRLLAFTPDRAGPNFRQVDRPNVESVEHTTSGSKTFLVQGVKAAVVGAVMVACGYAFNFDQFAEDIALDGTSGAAGAIGVGGLLGMVGTFIDLLAQLDDLLRLFGSLALLLGVVVLGVYVWSREQLLVVTVAGEDDVELTAPAAGTEELLGRLQTAVQSDGPTPAAGSVGDTDAGSGATEPLGSDLDVTEPTTADTADGADDGTLERSDSGDLS